VALVNQLLMVFGYTILPITEQQISELCTALFTIIAALWAWWTDNRMND
jgi:SPP1 family holin